MHVGAVCETWCGQRTKKSPRSPYFGDTPIPSDSITATSVRFSSSRVTRPTGPSPTSRTFEIVSICSHFTQLVSRRPDPGPGVMDTWKGISFPFVVIARTIVFGYRSLAFPASF